MSSWARFDSARFVATGRDLEHAAEERRALRLMSSYVARTRLAGLGLDIGAGLPWSELNRTGFVGGDVT